MSRSTPLPEPFVLTSRRTVATLQDAADLVLRLPKARQANPVWMAATEALMRAAQYPFEHQVEKANLAMWKALRAERMVGEQRAKART